MQECSQLVSKQTFSYLKIKESFYFPMKELNVDFCLFLYRNFTRALWERNKFYSFILQLLIFQQSHRKQTKSISKEFPLQTSIHPYRLRSQFCHVLTRKHASDYSREKNQEFPNTFSCRFQCVLLSVLSIPASSRFQSSATALGKEGRLRHDH